MTTEREFEPYDYIVYENKTDKRFPWSAYIHSKPDVTVSGVSPAQAIMGLNIQFWHERQEREQRMDRCFTRMRREIRLAAGVPKPFIGFHRWFLFGFKKKERDEQYDRMTEIVKAVEAEHNDLTWEQRTDLCIYEFNKEESND